MYWNVRISDGLSYKEFETWEYSEYSLNANNGVFDVMGKVSRLSTSPHAILRTVARSS